MSNVADIKNASSFISSLIIPEPYEYEVLSDRIRTSSTASSGVTNCRKNNTKSAQVNAGSLTSFTEKLTGQDKADIQNATLLAQLAATKKHDRFKQPMDWYKFYINVLGNIGFNQPSFSFDTYTSGDSTVNLDEAIIGILAAIASDIEIEIVSETIGALNACDDDSRQMTIWNANSSNGNNGNFQIFPASKSDNGDVVMLLDGMQFQAQTSHGRFLWWTWESTDINIERAANKFILNDSIYSKVRSQIVEKLGSAASTFVSDLDI